MSDSGICCDSNKDALASTLSALSVRLVILFFCLAVHKSSTSFRITAPDCRLELHRKRRRA